VGPDLELFTPDLQASYFFLYFLVDGWVCLLGMLQWFAHCRQGMGSFYGPLGHLCGSTGPASLEPTFQAQQDIPMTGWMFKNLQSQLERK
jgi:hypothetical protein